MEKIKTYMHSIEPLKSINREENKMKTQLGNQAFYVLDQKEKMVYKVGEFETNYNSLGIHIHLELVAGWDYVNPDENDLQGWCKAERFVEDVQDEIIYCNILIESMEEALMENDYIKLENIPQDLQKIINEHNEK